MSVSISIIIVTKNRSRLLARALEGVRSQEFKDYELVIVNDGSEDATPEVLSTIPETTPHIVINHQASCGITVSRQEALMAAQGRYVAFLDDDDLWIDSTKLSRQHAYMLAHPRTVIVGSAMNFVDPTGLFLKVVRRPINDAEIRRSMLFKNPFFTSTVLVDREAAIAVGGFIGRNSDVAEDYDLWLRLGNKGEMHNEPSLTTQYRFIPRSRYMVRLFLKKQYFLLSQPEARQYPYRVLAKVVLVARIVLGF